MKIEGIDIEWLGHASFILKGKGKIIYIDPYNLSKINEKADIILITHSHYDHCSIADMEKIVKEGSNIIIPANCQSKITKLKKDVKMKIIDPWKSVNIDDINILAVPSYNNSKQFHPKQEGWCGYIVDLGIKIYHAGDTDIIEEMKKLNGKVDVALLPVGGTYTMNADEAARAALLIKPKIAIPMHYGSIVGSEEDAKRFLDLCKQAGIKAEKLK